jgi:hypothetical protein
MIPIFGRLSDVYGKKKVLLTVMIIYAIGSRVASTHDSENRASMPQYRRNCPRARSVRCQEDAAQHSADLRGMHGLAQLEISRHSLPMRPLEALRI